MVVVVVVVMVLVVVGVVVVAMVFVISVVVAMVFVVSLIVFVEGFRWMMNITTNMKYKKIIFRFWVSVYGRYFNLIY